MDTDQILIKLTDIVIEYGPKLVGAIVVLFIGLKVVVILTKATERFLDNQNLDISLKPFLKGIINILLKVLLIVSVLSMLGVEMTSFIAMLGAAGLAIGMALSGTLQNFAGGVILLILKPFKVGDFIETQGFLGTVKEIQIFSTYILTVDNRTVIIPNGGLSTSSLINFTKEPIRRVDWTFGIAYGDDTDKAKKVILELCQADTRILGDPEPFVAVSALANSSVNFTVRAWVNSPDYWGVFFDMNDNIYKTFGKEGLNIPFPQMDVHVKNSK
ncbi:MAG: mechanosensitive ion channel [Candidatus Kapabacteria bacterium]|nr:mechanosensitive ion channel [Ignavibacteriota bacterium]MCW5885311.1 mechanosensitive ion channel [Candidatus Kapabacteria bacterium]